METSSPDRAAFAPPVVNAVAYAVGKVIATATVDEMPSLRGIDALGRAAAIHTMAEGMVGQLQAEAIAAIGAFLRATEPEAIQ